MIKYIYQQKKKKKGETLFFKAKIDTLPTLQKKKRTAVLVVRTLECVHSLHSLISFFSDFVDGISSICT
jgi:hypothetical protein